MHLLQQGKITNQLSSFLIYHFSPERRDVELSHASTNVRNFAHDTLYICDNFVYVGCLIMDFSAE